MTKPKKYPCIAEVLLPDGITWKKVGGPYISVENARKKQRKRKAKRTKPRTERIRLL